MKRLRRLARRVQSESRTLLGAATAVVVVPVVVVGCSYGPAPHSPRVSTSVEASASASTEPGAVSILPGMAPLGMPLTAKGATITPRAENLAVMRQGTGDDLELGIEVSFTGVTAQIDATGPNGGFRLYVNGGEQIPTSRPAVIKSPPLPARVRADTNGWVFFHIKPGMLPSQLQLTAAPAGYGLEPAPIAIWIMPPKLPGVSSPAPPPQPAPSAEPAPAPAAPSTGGGNGGQRGPRLPQLPPPPRLPPPPQLPRPQLPPPPPVVCQHTPLC